jgi:hypothetical protein
MKNHKEISILYLLPTLLLGLSSCGGSTKFRGVLKSESSPESFTIKRDIASESPISKGCNKILNEILYLKQQEEYKKNQKNKSKN